MAAVSGNAPTQSDMLKIPFIHEGKNWALCLVIRDKKTNKIVSQSRSELVLADVDKLASKIFAQMVVKNSAQINSNKIYIKSEFLPDKSFKNSIIELKANEIPLKQNIVLVDKSRMATESIDIPIPNGEYTLLDELMRKLMNEHIFAQIALETL